MASYPIYGTYSVDKGVFLGIAAITLLAIRLYIYPFLFASLGHVPGPLLSRVSSLPLIFSDLTYNRNDYIRKLHKAHGPIVRIAPNEVSVATLEATKEVYGTTNRWAKSNYFDFFKGYNMRSVFASKPYDEHRSKRRLTSAFYQATTIYKLPEIEAHVQERSRAVLSEIEKESVVDVYQLTDWFAFDIINFLAFGPHHGTHSVEVPGQERDILRELKRLQFLGPLRVRCPFMFHPIILRLVTKMCPQLGYVTAEDKLSTWSLSRMKEAVSDERLSKSHSLIRHLRDHGRDKQQPLDEWFIAAEVLDNINAAEATVAVTATYLIWELTMNPQWQHRIRSELALLQQQADGSLSFSDVNSMVPSLEACLREVYRLYPASSGRAERIVPKDGCRLEGVWLPERTIVTNSLPSLHRNDGLFPDPELFCPERWLDIDAESWTQCDANLMPFGYGGRICLGKALATMEIKLLVARLYLEYETTTTPRTTAESMKQCSTHDAVPWGLECTVRFRKVRVE